MEKSGIVNRVTINVGYGRKDYGVSVILRTHALFSTHLMIVIVFSLYAYSWIYWIGWTQVSTDEFDIQCLISKEVHLKCLVLVAGTLVVDVGEPLIRRIIGRSEKSPPGIAGVKGM